MGNHMRIAMNVGTVHPRYNEPRYNEPPAITNQSRMPGETYRVMYAKCFRYNEPRYNEFPAITNLIWQPKRENQPKSTPL